jgi:hypothetical protein
MKIETDQMWRRKLDQTLLIVSGVVGNSILFYEYRNPKVAGVRSRRQWLEECYLLGVDDVIIETGGIF